MRVIKKVTNEPFLVRDMSNKAIINEDENAYNKYMERKQRLLEKDNEIKQLRNEVEELKSLFNKLMENLKNGNSASINN
jgi:hypothetical protein